MFKKQMKHVYPDYYPRFQCIAGKCRHSCCVGWEIDIDADTLAAYRQMDDALGERLRRNIDADGAGAHFRLDAQERCPFLNRAGLCEIILEKGERALCQICADHPRFRSCFSDREEMGLGLCCEAACELILRRREPVRFLTEGEEMLMPEEAAFLSWRDAMIALFQDRSRFVAERMERILAACGRKLPACTPREWAQAFLQLECMDEAWTTRLLALDGKAPFPAPDEIALEQLLVYFLYRHLPAGFEAGDVGGYAAFAVHSVRMIASLARDDHDLLEVARLYSAEIEYSDENVQVLVEAIQANA